jgi:hypothetical protein
MTGTASFSSALDGQIGALGLTVLRTPIRAPKANAYCEGQVGTIRRGCPDYVIPLDERHLRKLLPEWVRHYNQPVRTRRWDRAFRMVATDSSTPTSRGMSYQPVRASRRRRS